MRHKYSPAILQALSGPIQKDYEYEKKLQDYKEGKSRMLTIKKVIDGFPKKLEGYKQLLDTIVGTCDYVFDKNQTNYCQFMHNITSAHRALENKLITLFNQFGQLSNSTNNWIKEINEVSAKCRQREECRKNYEHYETKLYELNTDRMKEIKKKNKISESDHERFLRNIGKFQKAGKEYIFASNSAFRAMEQFLNIRYDRIVTAMVSFIEAERSFYNEASHIMNFFSNIRNNSIGLKKTLIPMNTKYDASNFIKGRPILNLSAEEIFSSKYRPLPPPNGYGGGYNAAPGPNQYGMGPSNNPNSQMNKEIVNPFSSDNNFGDNPMNNNNNNYGRAKTFNINGGFNNQSTRDTFALNNPYNTQANPYSGNLNNNMNNNNFGPQNNYGPNNNNLKNPYDGNRNNNDINPYDGNNNDFGGNNDIDPYGGNNDVDPYGGNNDVDPYGGDNNQFGENNNTPNQFGNNNNNDNNNQKNNNNNLGNNNNNQNNNNDNNKNGDEDPFDF